MSRAGRPMSKIANPFDSDSDTETKPKAKTSSTTAVGDKSRYKNGFRESGGFENQSVQELENYALYKAEETTQSVDDCLKIAEMIKDDASKTLVTLYEQGEQIQRTHETAVKIDQDLSRGEKLLGSLGGIFSKPWKPKKTRQIKGPSITKDDSFKRRGSNAEQREKLGLASGPKQRTHHRHSASEPSALEKVEMEKAQQDDTLSDVSDILGQLKGMALDMGTELNRQNKALDGLHDDVDELNARVKGANQQGRRLLGK